MQRRAEAGEGTASATAAASLRERSSIPARFGRGLSFAAPVIFLLIISLTWEALVKSDVVNSFLLPAPSSVVAAQWSLLGDEAYWLSLRITTYETLVGFAIGTVVGISLGAAIAMSRFLRRGFHPYVVLFQSLPKTALAPTFLLWFGFGVASKIVHAAAIAFFPVLVNTIAGLDSLNQAPIMLMRSYGASNRQLLTKVSIPHALPTVMAGVKTAMSLALVGAIVSEFIGAREGIGFLIHFYSFRFRIDYVFALLATLAFLGLFLYWVIDMLDRRFIFWRSSRAR
ncbi:MAG: ABC transporter permease [Actinomycetota bacterium]